MNNEFIKTKTILSIIGIIVLSPIIYIILLLSGLFMIVYTLFTSRERLIEVQLGLEKEDRDK